VCGEDLSADPAVLEEPLGLDPLFGPRMKDNPGVRIPGAWDGFEVAVLAILGQRLAPHCAARMGARLASMFGRVVQDSVGLDRAFPTADQLAEVDIEQAGVGPEAALAIRSLATKVSSGTTSLNSCIDVQGTVTELAKIPGISRLTVEYILMRGLGEPDAFPFDHSLVRSGDLGSEHWRPWRAYAAMLLWRERM
jgi:AraC family transcriptional regulator of adaptative response / DNA-3-methyladenine glycosylase II